MQTYLTYFKYYRKHKLAHYTNHWILANIGLFASYIAFGSITFWEALLFLVVTLIPLFDELFAAAFEYLVSTTGKMIINNFLAGNIAETLYLLHIKRLFLRDLLLHNIVFYFCIVALLYVTLMFDLSIPFYILSGILVHLYIDLINDQYEFNSLEHWWWPFRYSWL